MKITPGIVMLCGICMLAGCTSANNPAPPTSPGASPTTMGAGPSANPAQEAAVDRTVRNAIEKRHLRSVIVKVTDRRQGDPHPGLRGVDDRCAGDDRHALPQRRRGDLIRLDAAAHARRREEGEPRRQGVDVAPRPAARRRGDARPARPDDVGLRRLRHRQHRDEPGAVRRPVPPVDDRRAPRLGTRSTSRSGTRRARAGTTPTRTT